MAKRKKQGCISSEIKKPECSHTKKQSVWERVGKICNSPMVGLLFKCIIYGKDIKHFVIDFLEDS